jgi:hypothetical protein
MKKSILAVLGVLSIALAAWWLYDYAHARRYAHQPYEVEEFDTPTFTVAIPRGWRRPNYADPRESTKHFMTSTFSKDEGNPYFVLGTLGINDEGTAKTVDAVIGEWRKDGDHEGRISTTRIGGVEAFTWTTVLPFVEFAGSGRTYVFKGTNGHVYSAYYMLSGGAYRMRQDYVYGRILASMKFHEERAPKGPPTPAGR